MNYSAWFAGHLRLETAGQLVDCLVCGVCGATDTQGIALKELIKSSTSDIPDVYKSGSVAACMSCAACLQASGVMISNLFACEDYAYRPMVALSSADYVRPAWRDLLRGLLIGTECVAIITSNTKRRLWPRAEVSIYGNAWRPLFVDGDIDRALTINVPVFLDLLNLVEKIYALGVSKKAILESLLFNRIVAPQLSIENLLSYERQLAPFRDSDELVLATFIAQKEIAS